MTQDKKIMFDAPEAAKRETVTVWRALNGQCYLEESLGGAKAEEMARYSSCKHRLCECGNETPKLYTKCAACRSVKDKADYEAMPFQEWDGKTLLALEDQYFSDESDIEMFCADHGITDSTTLQLVICEPVEIHEIDGDDYFCDQLPEDGELHDVAPLAAAALDEFNRIVREHREVTCWMGGKFRTTVKVKIDTTENQDV